MQRTTAIIVLALALCINVLAKNKTAPDLKNRKSGEMVEVIIQFEDFESEKTAKKAEKVVKKAGGEKVGDLELVGAGVYSVPVEALEELASDPNVRYISPNRGMKPRLDYAVPTISADIAHEYGWTGRGVGVAVIDSGISTHEDIPK